MSANSLPDAELQKHARMELPLLREELRELKRCQLHYFTLSITGTGAILAFSASLCEGDLVGLSLLAPLVILAPCWWIFFDKATTITRIVGYVRHVEKLLTRQPDTELEYPGYEEALQRFRETEDNPAKKKECLSQLEESWKKEMGLKRRLERWLELLTLRGRHRYWMVNLYSFAGLASLCWISALWFPVPKGPLEQLRCWALLVGAVVIGASLLYGFITVHQLTLGRRSYAWNEAFWSVVLRRKDDCRGEAGAQSSGPGADAGGTDG